MTYLTRAPSRPRVLIVEDEIVLAWDLEDVLRTEGYEVAGTAVSVDAALDMMAGKPVDAVILDINLKGHLSTPLIYELKRRNVPFLVTTAYSGLLEAEEAALIGVTILSKPVSREVLVAEVNRLTRESETKSTAPSNLGLPLEPLQNEVGRLFCDD
jgi:DNA-binding response OmpR family regulator